MICYMIYLFLYFFELTSQLLHLLLPVKVDAFLPSNSLLFPNELPKFKPCHSAALLFKFLHLFPYLLLILYKIFDIYSFVSPFHVFKTSSLEHFVKQTVHLSLYSMSAGFEAFYTFCAGAAGSVALVLEILCLISLAVYFLCTWLKRDSPSKTITLMLKQLLHFETVHI